MCETPPSPLSTSFILFSIYRVLGKEETIFLRYDSWYRNVVRGLFFKSQTIEFYIFNSILVNQEQFAIRDTVLQLEKWRRRKIAQRLQTSRHWQKFK